MSAILRLAQSAGNNCTSLCQYPKKQKANVALHYVLIEDLTSYLNDIIIIMVLFYLFIQYYAVLKEITCIYNLFINYS